MLFKHILLSSGVLITIVVVYILIKNFINNFHKIYLKKSVVKYPILDYDINFLNKKSKSESIEVLLKLKRYLFYTDKPWSSKNNNYIHDKLLDRYHIIDKGYYYFLEESRYTLVINNKCNIKLFDINKYSDKIVFL